LTLHAYTAILGITKKREVLEMTDIITLIDEENVEHEFEIEAFLDVENNKYAVLIPICDDEAEDEAVLMRFGVDEDGEDILYDIEDDEEWEKVAEAYEAYAEEEYGPEE